MRAKQNRTRTGNLAGRPAFLFHLFCGTRNMKDCSERELLGVFQSMRIRATQPSRNWIDEVDYTICFRECIRPGEQQASIDAWLYSSHWTPLNWSSFSQIKHSTNETVICLKMSCNDSVHFDAARTKNRNATQFIRRHWSCCSRFWAGVL